MRKKLKAELVGLMAIGFLLLTVCDPFNLSTEPGGTSGDPKPELNIAIRADLPGLDPHSSDSDLVGGLISHTNEPLFAMDGNLVPAPVLARSYEVSEDGLTYTFRLREGVLFHNGEEMVADDVVASMTRWLEVSGKANALLRGSVFARVDDYTITLTLPEPYTDALDILAGSVQFPAVYPKSVIDSAGPDGITKVIGTGPYQFVKWKRGKYVHLTRFEGYQPLAGEASGFAGKKEAATKDIYFRIVPDPAARTKGLKTGAYDIAEAIPARRYEELSEDPALRLLTRNTGTLDLFFNTTKGIMADRSLRKAILIALNTDEIMLAALGDPSLYLLNAGWADPNDAAWATDAGYEFYNLNDLDAAADHLAAAGYRNEEIVLMTTGDRSELYDATTAVQAQLVAAGINARVESHDLSDFMEKQSDPNAFDLIITSDRYSRLPVQLPMLLKDGAGLDHPRIPEDIAAIRRATPKEAVARWAALQTFIYDYAAASVLGHYSSVIATSSKTEGVIFFDYPLYWNARAAE